MKYELTQMQLFQVLDEARKECSEEGKFTIDLIFVVNGENVNVWIEGDMHIIYDGYEADDWYNDGYNDERWESERNAIISEAKVYTKDKEYDLSDDDIEKVDEFINDIDNFN